MERNQGSKLSLQPELHCIQMDRSLYKLLLIHMMKQMFFIHKLTHCKHSLIYVSDERIHKERKGAGKHTFNSPRLYILTDLSAAAASGRERRESQLVGTAC